MRCREAALALALAGCGGGGGTGDPDAAPDHDGGFVDAALDPAPPVLGAQLDRAGRPMIRTLLVGPYEAPAMQATLRDAYRVAANPATWKSTQLIPNITIERELARNLAVFDAFERHLGTVPSAGCGNALLYNPPANAASYNAGADLLADDQIYVDTSKATCNIYLELEVERIADVPHMSCGGRTLGHDVVDMTYSVIAAGYSGLNPASQLSPRMKDNVAAHGDIKDTFPFLGAPK